MLLSYGRPTIVTVTLVGTGAAFLTPSSALTNGRPADATRLQWLSASSPAITDYVEIQFQWSSGAFVPRCAALLMPNIATALPPGVKVNVYGNTGSGFTVNLGGNTQAQRTVQLPSGASAAWYVTAAGLAGITGISFRIYNDRNGSTWATSSTLVDLGECWFGTGADFLLKEDFKDKLMGGILQRQSHNNQAWPLLVQPWRELTFNLAPMTEIQAIGPNPAQDDFQTVMQAIGTQAACVVIPSYLNTYNNAASGLPAGGITTSTISAQRLQRTARLGVMDQPPELDSDGDHYFVSPQTHGETPC